MVSRHLLCETLLIYVLGPEAFRAHINSIPPHCRPIDNNPNDNLLSRLRFPLWYADFHEMFAAGDKEAAAKLLIGILNSGWVPRWWWGIILIDAGGLLQGWYNAHIYKR